MGARILNLILSWQQTENYKKYKKLLFFYDLWFFFLRLFFFSFHQNEDDDFLRNLAKSRQQSRGKSVSSIPFLPILKINSRFK